jgi:hypothetical protein
MRAGPNIARTILTDKPPRRSFPALDPARHDTKQRRALVLIALRAVAQDCLGEEHFTPDLASR